MEIPMMLYLWDHGAPARTNPVAGPFDTIEDVIRYVEREYGKITTKVSHLGNWKFGFNVGEREFNVLRKY